MAIALDTVVHTTTPLSRYPPQDSVTMTATTGFNVPWVNGDWEEIVASTPGNWLIADLLIVTGQGYSYEVDLGIWDDGSQTVLATVAGYYGTGGSIPFQAPVYVPEGTHLWARFRHNVNFGERSITVALQYYEEPFTGNVVYSTTGTLISAGLTDGTLIGGGASWVNSAWVEVEATTTAAWTLNGAMVNAQFFIGVTESAVEIDVGVGALGSEVVVTTLRSKQWFGTAGTNVVPIWPLFRQIPAGSRVTLRARSAVASITYRVKLIYYEGLASTLITTGQASVPRPSAATAITVTAPASAWTSGSWAPILDPTATAIAVTQLIVEVTGIAAQCELDLGYAVTGSGANSEVAVTTWRWAFDVQSTTPPNPVVILPVPVRIPAGQRVSLRLRSSSGAGNSVVASILTIASPTFGQLSADAFQQVYLASDNSVSPDKPAVEFDYSDWAELDAATETAILVSGVSWVIGTAGGSSTVLVQIGVGASGSEDVVGTWSPSDASAAMTAWVPSPFLVSIDRGERVSLRWTSSSALADTSARFAVTYYAGDTPDIPDAPATTEYEIRRLRRTPVVSDTGQRIYHNMLQVDVQPGIGNATAPGLNPTVLMRMSDDNGMTWSSVRKASAGVQGAYNDRVMFWRNGMSRNRVYEFVMSDPVAQWVIVQCWISAEAGNS